MVWETIAFGLALCILIIDVLVKAYLNPSDYLLEKEGEEYNLLNEKRNTTFEASLISLGFIISSFLTFQQINFLENQIGMLYSGLNLILISLVFYTVGGKRRISFEFQFKSVLYGIFLVLMGVTVFPQQNTSSFFLMFGVVYITYRIFKGLLIHSYWSQEDNTRDEKSFFYHLGNAAFHILRGNKLLKKLVDCSKEEEEDICFLDKNYQKPEFGKYISIGIVIFVGVLWLIVLLTSWNSAINPKPVNSIHLDDSESSLNVTSIRIESDVSGHLNSSEPEFSYLEKIFQRYVYEDRTVNTSKSEEVYCENLFDQEYVVVAEFQHNRTFYSKNYTRVSFSFNKQNNL